MHGCTYTEDFEMVQNTELDIQLSVVEPINCYNFSNGEVIATVTGGSPEYSYKWTMEIKWFLYYLMLLDYPRNLAYDLEVTDNLG